VKRYFFFGLTIFLISLITPIPKVLAEATACGELETDLGAAAAKSPSQYFEVEVPAGHGDTEESIARKALEKLSNEIDFSKYASLMANSLSKTYQEATTKLQPPQDSKQSFNPQPSKNKVYVTACVSDTDFWFSMPTQEITGENLDSLSLSAQATTPLKNYLVKLPPSQNREQEIINAQARTLSSVGNPGDNALPKLALNLRPKIEGDPTTYNIYWDLCLQSAQNTCTLDNFITEIESGGEIKVITPGTANWGHQYGATCISTEQVAGISPFKVKLDTGTSVTVRVIGEPTSATCNYGAAQVSGSVLKSNTWEQVTKGTISQTVPCPGTYTPPGRTFASTDTCISGECRISPVISLVRNVAKNLWLQLTAAISDCMASDSPAECLSGLFVKQTVPIHVYYYPSGGNYGLNLDNISKEGFDPGQAQLFRPPNDEYSHQGALEPSKSIFGDNALMHAVGPIKSVYTKIECDYLTPPGQKKHCDSSEML